MFSARDYEVIITKSISYFECRNKLISKVGFNSLKYDREKRKVKFVIKAY